MNKNQNVLKLKDIYHANRHKSHMDKCLKQYKINFTKKNLLKAKQKKYK